MPYHHIRFYHPGIGHIHLLGPCFPAQSTVVLAPSCNTRVLGTVLFGWMLWIVRTLSSNEVLLLTDRDIFQDGPVLVMKGVDIQESGTRLAGSNNHYGVVVGNYSP